MSENTPSSDNGGLNDPLKLRNTDTGTLKRVPAANPSLASSAARKTIKLKPLSVTPEAAPVSTATVTMNHVPPPAASAAPEARISSTSTVPLTAQQGSATPSGATTQKFVSTMTAQMTAAGVVPPKGSEKFVATTTEVLSAMPPPSASAAPASPEAPGRFASTTTAPISHTPMPTPTPIPKPNLGTAAPASTGTTTTQAIPKIKPADTGRPVINLASSGPAPKPAINLASVGVAPKPAVPTTTEGLPKAKPAPGLMPKIHPEVPTTTEEIMKPVAPTASTPPPASTATQSIPKARPAIMPKPVVNLSETPPPVPPLTATQNLPKASSQSTLAAVSQSGFQTAKPAIKLRPSAAPEQVKPASAPPPPAVPPTPSPTPSVAPAASAQTIKLSPRPASAVSPHPPVTPAETPVAEVVPPPAEGNSSGAEDTRTTKLPKKTVSLKPAAVPKPSDPTVSLHQQSDIPTTKKSEITAEEQTIALKGIQEEEKAENPEMTEHHENVSLKTEPSLLFTITAGVAVIIVLFMAYALTAQYLNVWEEKSMPVVIFEQIKGK